MSSIILLLLVLFCSDSESSNNYEMAKVSVKLVDEPEDYQKVYIEIIEVKVKYENDDFNDDEQSWASIGIINPLIYNLLGLTGGVSLQLVVDEEIETGTIKQIRLILGDANSVVLEGETESRPLYSLC
jgi:hypothetical protein